MHKWYKYEYVVYDIEITILNRAKRVFQKILKVGLKYNYYSESEVVDEFEEAPKLRFNSLKKAIN